MNYWRILGDRRFRLLAIGALFSRFGDVVAGLGFLYASYELTGSRTQTTAVAVAEVLPYLLFGLIGGALSDLLPKIKVMIVVDVLRAALQLGTFLLFQSGQLSFPALFAVAFAVQLGGCFFNPSSRAVIVDVVGDQQRVSANSVLSVIDNLSTIVGPVVAVGLLSIFGVSAFFAVDGVTYVVSAVSLVALLRYVGPDTRETPIGGVRATLARIPGRMAMFFGHVRQDRTLILLFASTVLTIICSTWAWQIGFFFQLVPDPGSDKAFFSLMLSVFAITGLGVSLLIPMLFAEFRIGHYWSAVLVWSAGLLCLGVTNGRVLTVVGVLLLGIGITTAAQARMFILQTQLPRAVMGQGFSSAAVLLYFGDTVSLVGFGAFADHVPVGVLITVAGAAMLGSVMVLGLVGSRGRSPVPVADRSTR